MNRQEAQQLVAAVGLLLEPAPASLVWALTGRRVPKEGVARRVELLLRLAHHVRREILAGREERAVEALRVAREGIEEDESTGLEGLVERRESRHPDQQGLAEVGPLGD